jgi:hypothetical protein
MEKKRLELKKLAELKATMLIAGRDIDQIEKQAIELCWLDKEAGKYSQELYDEHYEYYQNCINLLESGKKLPSTKIEGLVRIVGNGSRVVGACSFETPYIVVEDEAGRQYTWCSNKVEEKDLLGRVGEQVKIRAFVRPCTGHLYRVKVTLAGRLSELREELKMWQESIITTEKLDDRILIFDRINSIKEEIEYLS